MSAAASIDATVVDSKRSDLTGYFPDPCKHACKDIGENAHPSVARGNASVPGRSVSGPPKALRESARCPLNYA